MTREITHMKAFTAALESIGADRFSIGSLPPTPELVDQYFDNSIGTGDRGEPSARGPWKHGWRSSTLPPSRNSNPKQMARSNLQMAAEWQLPWPAPTIKVETSSRNCPVSNL
jgi:Mn-containing catalase